MRYYFKSINLIGDAMCIAPAWRQWLKTHGVDSLSDKIYMQTLPDHTAPLYQGMVRDLVNIETVFSRPEGEFSFEHTFDVNEAFKISDQKKCHVIESYAELLNVTLPGEYTRPGEYNPRLKLTYIPDYTADGLTPELWGNPETNRLKGCILISSFSASCTSRDPKCNHVPNKMLPWEKWKPMLRYLREIFPNTPIRFLGAPTDIIPNGYAMGLAKPGEYALGIPLNRLALVMTYAKLVVTIDNGMSHLAASQEANMFLMYPQCLGSHYILPVGNPNLRYVQMNPVTVSPAQLLHGLRSAVEHFKAKGRL